jgi:hypothetical protein
MRDIITAGYMTISNGIDILYFIYFNINIKTKIM